MAIQQCKNRFTTIKFNGRSYSNPMWDCVCDTCGKKSVKPGEDPGQASDNARKENFKPVPVTLTAPMIWVCEECGKKRAKK